MYRIFIVEDDEAMARTIRSHLCWGLSSDCKDISQYYKEIELEPLGTGTNGSFATT